MAFLRRERDSEANARLIASLAGARPTRDEEAALWAEIDASSELAGLDRPVASIIIVGEIVADALTVGCELHLGLGLPLLATLDRDELHAVITHALGHPHPPGELRPLMNQEPVAALPTDLPAISEATTRTLRRMAAFQPAGLRASQIQAIQGEYRAIKGGHTLAIDEGVMDTSRALGLLHHIERIETHALEDATLAMLPAASWEEMTALGAAAAIREEAAWILRDLTGGGRGHAPTIAEALRLDCDEPQAFKGLCMDAIDSRCDHHLCAITTLVTAALLEAGWRIEMRWGGDDIVSPDGHRIRPQSDLAPVNGASARALALLADLQIPTDLVVRRPAHPSPRLLGLVTAAGGPGRDATSDVAVYTDGVLLTPAAAEIPPPVGICGAPRHGHPLALSDPQQARRRDDALWIPREEILAWRVPALPGRLRLRVRGKQDGASSTITLRVRRGIWGDGDWWALQELVGDESTRREWARNS